MQQHEEYFRCPGFVCCLELSSLWPPLFLISAPALRDSTADSVWPCEKNTSSPVDPFHSREIAKSTREADKSILATILAGRRRPFSSVMFQVTLVRSRLHSRIRPEILPQASMREMSKMGEFSVIQPRVHSGVAQEPRAFIFTTSIHLPCSRLMLCHFLKNSNSTSVDRRRKSRAV